VAAWTKDAPEEVTSVGRLLQIRRSRRCRALRGRQVVVVEAAFLGAEAEGGAAPPLRELGPELDTVAMMPAAGLTQLHQDPPARAGPRRGWMLDGFDGSAAAALVMRRQWTGRRR
jgi:hypothetical protein